MLSGLRLVKAVVAKYLRAAPWNEHHRDDLEGAGALGLVEAEAVYRPGRASFVSFCWGRVLGAVRRYVRALRPSRELFESDEPAAEANDPSDKIDAPRVWGRVVSDHQGAPIAAGKGQRERRAGEAEDLFQVIFGGMTQQELADRRGVTQQTIAEQVLRVRREFAARFPEAAAVL